MKGFLPEGTRLSQVRLRTGDLKRALRFYTGALGLVRVEHAGQDVALGAADGGAPLVLLNEDPNSPPRPSNSTGLYHFAIRYQRRSDLAWALERLIRNKHPIQGASDHKVSEAIYLADPDLNGIELYVDRPRSQWVWRDGQVRMTTEPLDLDDLLAESGAGSNPPPQVPGDTELGHIHLNVANLSVAEKFYRDYLWLEVTQRSYPGALFFAAGGYHHHVATNIWAGDRPAPVNSAGLVSYRFQVPVAEILYCLQHRAPLAGYESRTVAGEPGREVLQIRDPNGHWLELEFVGVTATDGRTAEPVHAGAAMKV